ncbi:MAG: hypothetical protein ABIT10_00525 [Alteraurantiacibacter sp.]
MTVRSILRRPAMALVAVTLGLGLAPLNLAAQGEGPHFRAQLATPAAQARTVAGGVVWRCAEASCTAPRTGTRPLRMCRELHQEVGAIVSFEVAGVALASDELARCNA